MHMTQDTGAAAAAESMAAIDWVFQEGPMFLCSADGCKAVHECRCADTGAWCRT
jgi:hypothetical protein